MWGCGDGGRLGLGEHRLGIQFEPILVEALVEERFTSVSCGNSHTLVKWLRPRWEHDGSTMNQSRDEFYYVLTVVEFRPEQIRRGRLLYLVCACPGGNWNIIGQIITICTCTGASIIFNV